jgi:hypothetical protein
MDGLSRINRTHFRPEVATAFRPSFQPVEAIHVLAGTESPPAAYEFEVFNFLLSHQQHLGIARIWRCRNVRVDGLIDLEDGQRLVLEIKYRMNWEKACQACSQFGWFVMRAEEFERPVDGAIVVFQDFSADWARRVPSRRLENGWNYWYTDHFEVEGLPCNLLRLRDNSLETFAMALELAPAG